MNAWFSLPQKTRREIFIQTGSRTGLPATAIEKDWWVTLALKAVFALPFAEHLVFKGGTSLSKGWSLIERFSEDIDLAIDRGFLGYEGDLSKTQIKKLRKSSYAFISSDFVSALADQLRSWNIPDVTLAVRDVKDSDTDPLVIELQYKTLTDAITYLQPRILIEVGARSLMEPSTDKGIRSLVGEYFEGRAFADDTIPIATVLPKRTFLEKIFLLHEEFQKPTENIRVERLSRHLYDLERLMDTEHGREAIEDDDLYGRIVAHRKKFNAIRGIDYANHARTKISITPPESVVGQWEKDYQTMRESMIYGDAVNFETLLIRLRELQNRLDNIGA